MKNFVIDLRGGALREHPYLSQDRRAGPDLGREFDLTASLGEHA
jgi:hypothetical protein